VSFILIHFSAVAVAQSIQRSREEVTEDGASSSVGSNPEQYNYRKCLVASWHQTRTFKEGSKDADHCITIAAQTDTLPSNP